MIKVNLFDHEFSHTLGLVGYLTASNLDKPTRIEWLYQLPKFEGITVFTERFMDNPIVDQVETDIKVCWLLESKEINGKYYSLIKQYEDKFDYILTHDEELLGRSPKYIKSLIGSSRVPDIDAKVYDKTKLCSMIASFKRETSGHKLRHEIASRFATKYDIDMWGSGYRGFDNKLLPLKDYYFTIAVMNTRVNNFFTEVLVDCFRLNCVPIYFGCENVGEYFDINGIITFSTIEELGEILPTLTPELYYSKLESVKNNFEIAKKYLITDDLIADTLYTIWEKYSS